MRTNRVKIKKILLAMDGSEPSFRASKYAIHLAKAEDAEIKLLHVIENIKQGGALGLQARYGNIRLVKGFFKAREKEARRWMERVKKDAKSNGVELSTKAVIDQSSKAGEILTYADKNNVDMIIVGTRGIGRYRKLLLGSVANAIVGNAKCPVLIVR